jgi:hypothetical protein
MKDLQSQDAAHLSAQREIQDKLCKELSHTCSARASLAAQFEALRSANESLTTEKEKLSSELASMKLQSPSSEDTASMSSLGDSLAPPAPLVNSDGIPVAVEIVQENTSVEDDKDTSLSQAAQLLHCRKQENPLLPLSSEESIQLLSMYSSAGVS